MRSPFETEVAPGEGRPVIEVAVPNVRLRAAPSTDAPPVKHATLAKGERLVFDSTRFRTVRSGSLVSIDTGSVSGRNFGLVDRVSRAAYYAEGVADTTLRTAAGDTVEYLQFRGEGTCFVRFHGLVINPSTCPTLRREHFRLIREPHLEWWIHVIPTGGSNGWLLVSDSTARVVKREF